MAPADPPERPLERPLELPLDLAGCVAGRADAWRQFVRVTAGVIHGAVRRALERRGAPASDIDDCVQDVYIRLLREECKLLRTFDPSRAALATWLTIIARTIVHERFKRAGLPIAHGANAADFAVARAVTPTPEPLNTPDLPWHLLSQQQRTVLHLLFREGLSVEAVATQLGIDPQSVRSAKHKALSRLRDELNAHRNGAPREVRGDESPKQRLSSSDTESDIDRDASRSPSIP